MDNDDLFTRLGLGLTGTGCLTSTYSFHAVAYPARRGSRCTAATSEVRLYILIG